MKPEDSQLKRLLKAAAAAPRPAGAAVFALEARVLGSWRGLQRETDGGEFLVAAFRRAAICGCILAVASLAWTHHARVNGGGALLVADSAMQMGVEP